MNNKLDPGLACILWSYHNRDAWRDKETYGPRKTQLSKGQRSEPTLGILPTYVRSGVRRFTDDEVRAIRYRYANGATIGELGLDFDASKDAIRTLLRGKSYWNVPNESETNTGIRGVDTNAAGSKTPTGRDS